MFFLYTAVSEKLTYDYDFSYTNLVIFLHIRNTIDVDQSKGFFDPFFFTTKNNKTRFTA